MKMHICFGASNGKPIDPVVCSRNKHGMWSCHEIRRLENGKKSQEDTSDMRIVSPAGNTCDFFLYEFDDFVLLKYPRQLICEETAFSEIERLFGKQEAMLSKEEYDKIKNYEDMSSVGLYGDGWMLFKARRFFGIVVNKNTPAWQARKFRKELERAGKNFEII